MFKLAAVLILSCLAFSARADDEFAPAIELSQYMINYGESMVKLFDYIMFIGDDEMSYKGQCVYRKVEEALDKASEYFVSQVKAGVGIMESDSAPYWQKHMYAELVTEMSNSTLLKGFFLDNNLVKLTFHANEECMHE